jgi:hypothetical protein
MIFVIASNPMFPSPILACLSLCEPSVFILSFKCIAYRFSNPIILSNSSSTLSKLFTMSYPPSNM